MDPVLLQFGSGPSMGFDIGTGFVTFRLFGLVFAAVGLMFAIAPRGMASRRIRTNAGYAATVEPTAAQQAATRLVGALFAVVGLAMFVGVFP